MREIPTLLEYFLGEGPPEKDDDMDALLGRLDGDDEELPPDDELELMTAPFRGANPFEPPARAKPELPKPGLSQRLPPKAARREPMAPPSKDAEWRPPESRAVDNSAVKPQYPGKFIGQSVKFNADVVDRRFAYGGGKDTKSVGNRRQGGGLRGADAPGKRPGGFGHVASQTTREFVWDGSDWVTPQEFLHKARTGQLRKK